MAHVLDGRKNRPCGKCYERSQDGTVLKRTVHPVVTGSAVENKGPLVGAARGGHACGTENALVQELPERFAARFFDNDAKQVVADVVVSPRLAWLELQRQFEEHLEQLPARGTSFQKEIGFESADVARHGHVVLNAGRVSEKMPDGDASPRFRSVGKILRDTVIKADFTLFDQHHDGR